MPSYPAYAGVIGLKSGVCRRYPENHW